MELNIWTNDVETGFDIRILNRDLITKIGVGKEKGMPVLLDTVFENVIEKVVQALTNYMLVWGQLGNENMCFHQRSVDN